MASIKAVLSLKSALDIELLETGNIITVERYLGVIKNGDENIKDNTTLAAPIISKDFRQVIKNCVSLVESNFL